VRGERGKRWTALRRARVPNRRDPFVVALEALAC